MSRRSRVLWMAVLPPGIAAGVIAAAAFGPVAPGAREEVFEIPKGTWARRMAGDKVDILPGEVRLMLGVKDILVLMNRDDVPQVFGPTLMMPGQSLRLPFEVAASYQFACTAHANGQMTVTVEPAPQPGWQRLAWRARSLMDLRGPA